MIYRVTKKFDVRSSEVNVGSYNSLAAARVAIQGYLEDDQRMKVNAVYFIYEGYDMLESLDQSKLQAPAAASGGDVGQGQGRGQSQSFRPTPLSTRPRPPGTPPPMWGDEDDDK